MRRHASCVSRSLDAYKSSSTSRLVKDSASDWLGPLEYRILSRLLELGRKVFTPKELGLDIDRRRLWDALQRLVARGILAKVSRGVYRVVVDLGRVLGLNVRKLNGYGRRVVKDRPMGGDGTRCVLSGVVGVVSGPLFDNVRGYVVSGRYVGGDRGRVVDWRELVFFERVSYAEVLYRVSGYVVPGQLVVYTNVCQDGEAIRVEWRPPRGYVKRNGLASAIRMYWETVLVVWRALTTLLRTSSPPDILRRFVKDLCTLAATLCCSRSP